MDRTYDAIYGVTGQIVETYPDDEEWRQGIPSSATVDVFDGDRDRDGDPDFSPTPTIDAVSTTVATAFTEQTASPKNKIYLASCASIVAGRHYLLENADTQRELVTPIAVNTTSGYVECEDDIRFDHTTASTFKGLRMIFTVDATWVATESNILTPKAPSYAVVWQYTVNSLTRRQETYLRLVRVKAKHRVTAKDISRRWPDVLDNEHRKYRGLGLRYVIDDAWGDFRFDLRMEGYEPSQIRDTELIDRIVIARTMVRILTAPGTEFPQSQIDEAKSEYDNYFNRAWKSLNTPIDTSTAGATTPDPIQTPIFRR